MVFPDDIVDIGFLQELLVWCHAGLMNILARRQGAPPEVVDLPADAPRPPDDAGDAGEGGAALVYDRVAQADVKQPDLEQGPVEPGLADLGAVPKVGRDGMGRRSHRHSDSSSSNGQDNRHGPPGTRAQARRLVPDAPAGGRDLPRRGRSSTAEVRFPYFQTCFLARMLHETRNNLLAFSSFLDPGFFSGVSTTRRWPPSTAPGYSSPPCSSSTPPSPVAQGSCSGHDYSYTSYSRPVSAYSSSPYSYSPYS